MVCGKTQFTLNSDRRHNRTLQRPLYSNCHRVFVDKDRRCAFCSCNYRYATGMPCSHLVKVIGSKYLDASMFHPRWYKTTNSHLYTDYDDIRSLTDKLVMEYRRDPPRVPLDAVWQKIENVETILSARSVS